MLEFSLCKYASFWWKYLCAHQSKGRKTLTLSFCKGVKCLTILYFLLISLALYKSCLSIAERELCSQQGSCRKGGAPSFIEGSACPHVFLHGCLLWNLCGPQVTDTAELMGSQVTCTSAFCAAPWWGVREMLAEELGCSCLTETSSGAELRLQECIGWSAAHVLTPGACVTSHCAGQFGAIKGLEHLLLCISSST